MGEGGDDRGLTLATDSGPSERRKRDGNDENEGIVSAYEFNSLSAMYHVYGIHFGGSNCPVFYFFFEL